MKNRLLDYGFGDEPKTPPAPKAPDKKPRARTGKSKRVICRLLSYGTIDDHEYLDAKMNICIDGSGQYYVRGAKVVPQQALRCCLSWEFYKSPVRRVVREIVDEVALRHLLDRVLPNVPREKDAAANDDNEGDEWKTANE